MSGQESAFQDHARCLCAIYGPFAQRHATEANLMRYTLMDALLAKRFNEMTAQQATFLDASLEKRFKAFERVVLRALPKESLARMLSTGDITVKAAMEDFGYDEQVVMTCVKELCKNPGSRAEVC
eukprot:947707-Amphidinium_carterae.1